MRVLVAGGVFRLSPQKLAAQQATPEVTLAQGLRERGFEVTTCRLEDISRILLAKDQDVVHVHHLSKGAVAGAASGHPFVFTAHSTKAPERLRERAGLRFVMHRADAAINLSERERTQTASLFPAISSRLRVIPNGIDFSIFPCATRYRAAHERFRLLFVGQLIEVKRVDRVLRAVHAYPDVELRLVYHNSHLAPKLQHLVDELGIHDRVTFVGPLSGADLAKEYAGAHALALPSLSEALPSVVSEALSTGLPVLASDVGGIREQCLHAGILSESTSDDGFTQSVRAAMQRYEALATNAAQRAREVREKFSVEAMIAAHIHVYEEVLAR